MASITSSGCPSNYLLSWWTRIRNLVNDTGFLSSLLNNTIQFCSLGTIKYHYVNDNDTPLIIAMTFKFFLFRDYLGSIKAKQQSKICHIREIVSQKVTEFGTKYQNGVLLE